MSQMRMASSDVTNFDSFLEVEGAASRPVLAAVCSAELGIRLILCENTSLCVAAAGCGARPVHIQHSISAAGWETKEGV